MRERKERKLTSTPKFRIDPDLAIREYELPAGKKETRPVVDKSGLALKIKLDPKTGIVRKDYYFAKGGDIKEKLGDAYKLTFRQALAMVCEIKKRDYLPDEKISKNTLEAVFLDYMKTSCKGWKPATIAKKKKVYKYLSHLGKTDIRRIKFEQLRAICDNVYNDEKYSLLRALCVDIRAILDYALDTNVLKTDPLNGRRLLKIYKRPKSSGFGYLKDEQDLKFLISYIQNYKHSSSVKNALIFGLCTALRAKNVRFLNVGNLKKDKNGEYYLDFSADEMKISSNGDELLGLPRKLGLWLENLGATNLYFPTSTGKPFSDAAFSKALENYAPLNPRGKIVFHSFRKILSTFVNQNVENGLNNYDVERALSHKVKGVSGIYDKSDSLNASRKVFTWWFNYLETLGLKL